MRPAQFDLIRPATLGAALTAAGDDATMLLAGGQSLLKQLRERSVTPARLIDLSALGDLAYARRTPGGLELGAMLTLDRLASDTDIGAHSPALAAAAQAVGDPQVRCRATLGGNLMSGWSGDLGVALAALGAEAVVQSTSGTRNLDVAALLGEGLARGEIIHGVRIPPTRASAFIKLSRRSADPALVSAAAVISETRGGARFALAVGGAHAHVVRLPHCETLLAAGNRSRAELSTALTRDTAGLTPPDTPHGSADYRLRVLPVITLRSIERVLETADAGALV